MKKWLITLVFLLPVTASALAVLTAPQGGTGIGSSAGLSIGDCLKVGGTSPFTWSASGCGASSSGFSTTSALWFESQFGDWNVVAGSYLTPTTTLGIILNASSTFTGKVTAAAASTTDLGASNSLFLNFAGGLVYSGASKQLLTQATSSATVSSPLTGAITVVGTGQTIGIQAATASQGGYETQNEFNYVHTATSTFSAPLVYTMGTNAVTCTNASNGVTGCMTANDWGLLHTATTTFTYPLTYTGSTNAVTFPATSTLYGTGTGGQYLVWANNVPTWTASTTYTGTSPMSLTFASGQVTSAIANAAADGSTKGAASFTANDFDATTGNISLDYTNGQAASASNKGFLTSADWATFNGKLNLSNLFSIATTFSTTTLATTTPFYFKTGFYASSTPTVPSRDDYFVAIQGTTTNATTTTLGFTGMLDSLLSTNHSGGVVATTSIGSNFLANSGVTAGSYTNASITVSAGGVITVASNGSAVSPGGDAFTHTLPAQSSTSTRIDFTGGFVSSASSTFSALTATTTFLGNVMLGNSANTGMLLGTTTPFQVSQSYNSYLQTLLWNTNSGSNASTEMVFNNNLSTASAYFGTIGINGGGYTNPLYSGERNNDLFVSASDGGIVFSIASTTASNATSSIDFLTKGTLSSNLRMRIVNDGRIMMGTSSPAWNLLTIASSTAPQISLSDGTPANNLWTIRAIANTFYLATSTAVATSSVASFSIDPNGIAYLPMGLVSNASSTFVQAHWQSYGGVSTSTVNAFMGVGFNVATSTTFYNNVGFHYASSTEPTQLVQVDWNQGTGYRIIASTTLNLVINATSSHPLDMGKYILKICMDGTGSRTVNFITPGQLRWGNGTTTISSAANTCSMIGMVYDATYQLYNVVASSTGMRIN